MEVDDALQHLVTRHFATPLMALRTQLGVATQSEVLRLSRSQVGPFWFPGVRLPSDIPVELGRGLLLHTVTEVVANDVHEPRHLDPWLEPPADEVAPDMDAAGSAAEATNEVEANGTDTEAGATGNPAAPAPNAASV